MRPGGMVSPCGVMMIRWKSWNEFEAVAVRGDEGAEIAADGRTITVRAGSVVNLDFTRASSPAETPTSAGQ